METLYIVMPAYNEEETIPAVVAEWYPVVETFGGEASRLVVADSGSTDRTHEILTELQKTHPKLVVLSDTGKFHGPKLIAMYRYAIAQKADWVFQTDSDGQTAPSEFEAFWQKRTAHDAICGVRLVRGDGQARAFVEKVVCFLLRLYFGVKVPDANAPYRLMKTSVLARYMPRFSAEYNLPNIMLTTFFAYYHENLAFLPITFKPRQGGKNSIDLVKICKIGWKALGDFRAFKQAM